MKKIIFMCVLLLWGGSEMMAQQERRNESLKLRAERMTERMAERYVLTDSQKEKLLKANTALLEGLGVSPLENEGKYGYKYRYRRGCCDGEGWGDSYCRPCYDDGSVSGNYPSSEAARQLRISYRKQLQSILAEEQFDDYLEENCR